MKGNVILISIFYIKNTNKEKIFKVWQDFRGRDRLLNAWIINEFLKRVMVIGNLNDGVILLLWTRILQGFAFLCKLVLLLFKPHWGYQI